MSHTLKSTCSIRVGMAGSLKRLQRFADSVNAYHVAPDVFMCCRCKTKWNRLDNDISQDLDRVTCSNCYSKNVRIVRVEMVTQLPNARGDRSARDAQSSKDDS